VGNLFPNCSWVMQATMGGPLCTLRTWNPVGPNHVELCSWVITHPAASEELRTVTATGYAQQFGISGMFEQDDLAIWSRIQRARQGAMGGRQDVDYSSGRVPNKTNQMSDACDWPGPGTVWESRGGAGAVADDAMWQFFLRWYALMTEA
jgi:hypothetical protein